MFLRMIFFVFGQVDHYKVFCFFELQLCAGPNVRVVDCTNRNSSSLDLYTLTLVVPR
jgi:hypothetical protein